MTGVIRLALFWHWQLAEKKKERESYYRDEKQREAEKRIR